MKTENNVETNLKNNTQQILEERKKILEQRKSFIERELVETGIQIANYNQIVAKVTTKLNQNIFDWSEREEANNRLVNLNEKAAVFSRLVEEINESIRAISLVK